MDIIYVMSYMVFWAVLLAFIICVGGIWAMALVVLFAYESYKLMGAWLFIGIVVGWLVYECVRLLI